MARILVVSQHFRGGGLETQIESFCKSLSARGDEIHIATGQEGRLDPIANFLSGNCFIERWSPEGESILAAASTLETYISRNRIDWVHIHPFEAFFSGSLAAFKLGIPCCVTLHGPSSLTWFPGIFYRAFLISCLLPDAARVFAVSLETANFVKSLASEVRPVILPNGIDLSRYRPAKRVLDGPWAIVARLDEEKTRGVQEALSLFAERNKREPMVKVVVFGDGNARPLIEHWAKSLPNSEGWLEFRGHTDQLPEELQKGWAGILGMGRVVLEAAAMNLPILLVGYDGVKGLVTLENIDRFAICNFSGRRERSIDFVSFQRILKEVSAKRNPCRLREWVKSKANAPKIWQRYRSEMLRKKGSNPLWISAFEDCCHQLGKESIYSADGVAHILESVIPSTGRKFTLGNGLLVEFLKVVDEKKNIDAELAGHRQASTQEKAWNAERISSLENQLIVVRQDREEVLRREAAHSQMLLDERAKFEERGRDLEAVLSFLKVERDRAVQSEALVRQALADEKAQWSSRVSGLEEELRLLRQDREEVLRREAAHSQMFLDERTKFEERIGGLETTLGSLEGEWYELIESEALQRQSLEKERLKWQKEVLTLEEEKTLVNQKLAEALRQLSMQEGMSRGLQQEKIALEGKILKLEEEKEEIFKSDAIHQQEANEFRGRLLQLIQAIEVARQSRSWRMMRLFRRLRLQAIHGDLRDKTKFGKWVIQKIFRLPPRSTDPSFDPLPQNLLESLFPSQDQIPIHTGEEIQKNQLSKLMLAVEVARQTLSWRIMRLLRRFREWVVLGNVKSRWKFFKWVGRKPGRKKEKPGNPSFDPIGEENFYDLASLQRAIENARKIRSWKAMCFLRALRSHVVQGHLKDLWQLRKCLRGILFKGKDEWDGWISFDPIPQGLMQPAPTAVVPAPVSEPASDGRPTYILALDRGWGDILMSLPVAEALKKKDRTCKVIYFLEARDHLPLLQNNPYIDEVNFSKDRIALYPDAKVFDIRHTPSDWHKARLHITDMIANHFGVEVHSRRPSLYVPDDQVTREKFGLQDPYAVAHLQSTTREKDWSLSNWAPVFDHLYRRHGLKTVIVGGTYEKRDFHWDCDHVVDLRGKTSLYETINIMKKAHFFIGVDSGPMHIAGAFNLPSVVLWGNTSPIICGIESDVVYNIEPERICRMGLHWTCHFFPCPEIELCINRIPVTDVIRSVNGCLSQKKGLLVIHIGQDPWNQEGLEKGAYAFIHRNSFTPRILNEWVHSSQSEHVVVISSETSDPPWAELDRIVSLMKKNGMGIVTSECLRYIHPGVYGEYRDNPITKCHRGSDAFVLFHKDVFTRIGGLDPRFDTLAGCLHDFYFRALLLNETIWYVENDLPVSGLGETSEDKERFQHKWGEVDLRRLQHLDSVSLTKNSQTENTLFLIFSHCSFDFNGGGQRWDSLAKMGTKNGYHLLYIDEIMPDEQAEMIYKNFLEIPSPRKIVIWARPVPRYQKYFDHLVELGIPQVYDCIDDWAHIMLEDPAVPSFEEALFKKSTMVTVTAETLREKVQTIRPWQPYVPFIPNGADPEIFDYRRNGEAPPDLRKASVTLGYFGSLAEWWIDDGLLCDLANKLDGQAVINLLGPCKQEYREVFSKYENIAVLGQKRHDELPSYLSQFDVALIPFKVIPVTESTSPVKAYEYLFGGKPIVSTDLPEVRHLPYTFCSKTHDDFLNNILKASQMQVDPAKLDEFRVLNSWESRFRELLIQIDLANPSKKSVDIIIVSYNTKDLTEACIRSIERYTKDYQLFVVDNHSADGSLEMLEEYGKQGRLRLIKNRRNEGYGKAVNTAFKEGSSEFVVILNSDIEVLSNWIEPLLETLSSDRSIAAVTPKLIGPNGCIDCAGVWGTNANPLIRFSEKNDFGKFNRVLENVYISGACIVTRRSTFAELGRFDERFFFYFEDMDFCFEARYRGYKIMYIPDSVIVHHRARASVSNQEQTQKWYSQSQQLFMEKWKDYLADSVEYPLE